MADGAGMDKEQVQEMEKNMQTNDPMKAWNKVLGVEPAEDEDD